MKFIPMIRSRESYLKIFNIIIGSFELGGEDIKLDIHSKSTISLGNYTPSINTISIRHNIIKAIEDFPDVHSNITYKAKTYIDHIIKGNSLVDNDALFVYILLHEIGHVRFTKVLDKVGLDTSILKHIEMLEIELIKFNLDEDSRAQTYKSHYTKDELYANNFTHTHFPRIYKALLSKGHIREVAV